MRGFRSYYEISNSGTMSNAVEKNSMGEMLVLAMV